MVLPNKEEILGTWSALSGSAEGDGWRSIALVSGGGCGLRAGRCFPGNEETLLVQFGDAILPVAQGWPMATGFKLERAHLQEQGEWLALVRQPSGSLDLFAMVVMDLVSTLLQSKNDEGKHLLHLFMTRLRAWMDFMKKGRQFLGPEAELGLIGELHCMTLLLDAGAPVPVLLDCWKGPEDGLQDFLLGNGAVEVKSTLAKEGFPATILSLEQLDDGLRQPIFLCACQFSIESSGQSLPEYIAALRCRMDEATAVSFGFSLLQAGYLDAHADRYVRRFHEVRTRFLLVDESFPRLTHGNVPLGITWAKYTVDLDAVEAPAYQAAKIIEMTGVI